MANDSSDEERAARKSFKVVDNRRFDEDGQERKNVGVATSGGGQSKASSATATPPAQTIENPLKKSPQASVASPAAALEAPRSAVIGDAVVVDEEGLEMAEPNFGGDIGEDIAEQDASGEGLDFSSFIVSLATQALMQLGLAQPGDELSLPVDKVAAMQTIDIIAMLQAKTRGNLTPSEAQLIEQVVHELRLAFVKVR